MMLGKIGEGKKRRNIIYEQPEVKDVNALKYELESFVMSVQQQRTPIVSGIDGRRALDVAGEIMRKIQVQRFNGD